MKKILILIMLLASFNSYALSFKVEERAGSVFSSTTEACGSFTIYNGMPHAYKFCPYSSSTWNNNAMVGRCVVEFDSCSNGISLNPKKVYVINNSCPSGSTLDKDSASCVADEDETCEKHKGTVLHGQRASYCMSSGLPRYYIGKCDVLASDGSVIIAPPAENASLGYLGDWVITGKPRSACIPDTEEPEEPKEPEEEKPDPEKLDEGSGGNEGGNDGGETGGGTGGGSTGGGSEGGSGGGGSGGGGSPGTDLGGGNGNGDGDGSGTGSEGGGTGGGGSGGSGNGDGDGEEDKPSAGGLPCNQALICKGDAVQCAQLEKQKQIQCAQEDLYRMDSEIKTDLQQQVNKNTQEVEGFGDKDGPVTNIGNLISKGSGWLPRSCPAPMHVNVHGQDLEFSYSNTCKLASDLSGLIVALFSFLAIRVFARQG